MKAVAVCCGRIGVTGVLDSIVGDAATTIVLVAPGMDVGVSSTRVGLAHAENANAKRAIEINLKNILLAVDFVAIILISMV